MVVLWKNRKRDHYSKSLPLHDVDRVCRTLQGIVDYRIARKTTKCGDSDKSLLTMHVLGYIKTLKDKSRLHYFFYP